MALGRRVDPLIEQATLDAIDGDADLDDGEDGEPSLASLIGGKARCAGAPAAMMTGRFPFRQQPEGRARETLSQGLSRNTCLLLRLPQALRLHYLAPEEPACSALFLSGAVEFTCGENPLTWH